MPGSPAYDPEFIGTGAGVCLCRAFAILLCGAASRLENRSASTSRIPCAVAFEGPCAPLRPSTMEPRCNGNFYGVLWLSYSRRRPRQPCVSSYLSVAAIRDRRSVNDNDSHPHAFKVKTPRIDDVAKCRESSGFGGGCRLATADTFGSYGTVAFHPNVQQVSTTICKISNK